MEITGPRIIQSILFSKLNIQNNDGCFTGYEKPNIFLANTPFEFLYKKQIFNSHKTNIYQTLQSKYKKKSYQQYNFI